LATRAVPAARAMIVTSHDNTEPMPAAGAHAVPPPRSWREISDTAEQRWYHSTDFLVAVVCDKKQ